MVIGERSNGKSFSVWDYALSTYLKTGKQLAVIRRWQEDFKGKRGHEMCSGIVSEGLVKNIVMVNGIELCIKVAGGI